MKPLPIQLEKKGRKIRDITITTPPTPLPPQTNYKKKKKKEKKKKVIVAIKPKNQAHKKKKKKTPKHPNYPTKEFRHIPPKLKKRKKKSVFKTPNKHGNTTEQKRLSPFSLSLLTSTISKITKTLTLVSLSLSLSLSLCKATHH